MTAEATNAELVRMFRRELELCKVEQGQTVAIYSEGGQRQHYAEAFAHAATDLGANVFHLDMPAQAPRTATDLGGTPGGSGLQAMPPLQRLCEECDLVVDLAFLLFTPEQRAIMAAGTRILSCIEPVDTLRRLFPTEDQRRRALEGEEMMREAKTLRLVNDAGTDCLFEFGDEYRPHCQYGIADTPGRWDHFATTLITHVAHDEGVNGTVVVQPGDMLFPFNRYASDPVRFEIKKGKITSIDGGVDAVLIRGYMESFDDERGYAVSHIGWGANENARWDAITTSPTSMGTDARSFYGGIMFSTGPNSHHGGSNDTLCHVDIPMRDCSLYVDDEPIVENGRVVYEAQKAQTEKLVAA